MKKIKFTEASIKAINFELTGGQRIYWDTEIKCFGLKVGKTKKTYFVQKKLHGRDISRTVGTTEVLTLKDARSRAQSYILSISDGIDPSRKNATLNDVPTLEKVYNDFIKDKKNTLKKGTLDNYRFFMKNHFSDWLRKPVDTISQRMVVDRHNEIGKTGKYAANHALRFIGTLYESLPDDEFNIKNPTVILKKRKLINKFEKKVSNLSGANILEWGKAVSSLQNESMKHAFLFLIFTGLRKQECLSLKWENIDFNDNRFFIPHTKNKTRLELPMTKQIKKILLEAKNRDDADETCVFPSERESKRIMDLKSALKIIKREYGIKFVTHDTRRAFSTFAYQAGMPDRTISALINHKSEKRDITSRYIGEDVKHLRTQAQKVANFIDKKIHLSDLLKKP